MDFWGILTLILLIVFFMSCCGWCCSSKKRGTVLSTPVVITSATHTAPGGYPVAQMPTPAASNTYQQQQTCASYPQQQTHQQYIPAQMPMPMPMPVQSPQPPMPGAQPYMAPYPQAPAPSMNPPSYDAVVGGFGLGAPNNASAGYEKQAPYNPNYNV